jgi:hypothetical protein
MIIIASGLSEVQLAKMCILEGTVTKTSGIRGNSPQKLKCQYM